MRLIDADELKERIRKALGIKSLDNLLPSEKTIVKQIDMASTIQPEPHWIPVTERLPEIGEYVLCTVRPPYRGKLHVCKYVDKDNFNDHPYFDWRHNGFPDVTAWMPLPEPYKESEVATRD